MRWLGQNAGHRSEAISRLRDPDLPDHSHALASEVTVKAIMDRNDGKGPGFDTLRLWLALCVLLVHGVAVAQYDQGLPQKLWSGPLRPFLLAILPMFFALSGFLVSGSAVRVRSARTFLALRLLRLLPALMVEVTLSALVLGPILTVVTLRQYFSDPLFLSYFGNIAGHVQFHLPGVFTAAPMAGVVNLNLWTLTPEYYCYAFMLLLLVSGALFDRLKIAAIAAIMFAILGGGNALFDLGEGDTMYGAPVLLMSFGAGACAYSWREHIVVRNDLFALAIITLYIAWSFHGAMAMGLLPMIYCTVYLGMRPLPRLGWLPEGDYSYGIYLYGFPIQQALVEIFPALKVWWALFPVAAVITIIVAVISWHVIERPALSLKRIVTQSRAWRTAS